jgi:flagellar biosynthesis/type III secretory pathway M-ring protein FliF/YscJ
MEVRIALIVIVGLVVAGTMWRAISRTRKPSGERTAEEHEEPAEHEQREEEHNEEAAHPIHRARWFGRGLALGVGLTTLYAPMRGAQLREQIADAIERWREKRLC